jgi:arginine exporter protein ArgO
MILVKIFLVGLVILVGAIVINALAAALGLSTWYTFLSGITQHGLLPSLRQARLVDLLFLFILYPVGLGSLAALAERLTRFL